MNIPPDNFDPSAIAKKLLTDASSPATSLPRDEDLAVRTVIGEAKNEGQTGWAAVAGVIRNRAQQTGKSAADIVLEPGQFEPWSSRRKELESIDPNSPTYQSVAQTILPVLRGEAPDPTNGADHFYSPTGQTAMGRKPPSWDNGTGTDIGRHRFFKLGYGKFNANALAQQLLNNSPAEPEASPSEIAQTLLSQTAPDQSRDLLKPGEVLAPDTVAPGGDDQTSPEENAAKVFEGSQELVGIGEAAKEGLKYADVKKDQERVNKEYLQYAKEKGLDPNQQASVDEFNKVRTEQASQKVLADNPDYANWLKLAGNTPDSEDARKQYTDIMKDSAERANATNRADVAAAGVKGVTGQGGTKKDQTDPLTDAGRQKLLAEVRGQQARNATEIELRKQARAEGQPIDIKTGQAMFVPAQTNKEILAGSAGSTVVDYKQKPKGMNSGRYGLQTALRAVASQYGLDESDIQAQLDAMQREGRKYSVATNDITDEGWQEYLKAGHPGTMDFHVTNALINEMLRRKKGGGDPRGDLTAPRRFEGSDEHIDPDLQKELNYRSALYAPYNPPDPDLRNPYLKATGDPLLDKAYQDVMTDPLSSGTPDAIKAQYEKLKRLQPSADEQHNDVNLGQIIQGVFQSPWTQTALGGATNAQAASGAAAGLIGGASRTLNFLTPLYRFTPLGVLNKTLANYAGVPERGEEALAKFASRARVVAAEAKGPGVIADIGEVGGGLLADAPRLIGLTALLGGNAVLAFAADEAMQSAGRGESDSEIATSLAHGAVMGAVFHGIGKVGQWAGTTAARRVLTDEVVAALNSPESDKAFAENVFRRAYKYDQRIQFPDAADSEVERQQARKLFTEKLESNGLTEADFNAYKAQVHASLRANPNIHGDVERLALDKIDLPGFEAPINPANQALFDAAKKKAVVVKWLTERGVSAGLVATAGFTSAKIQGKSNREALHDAGLWLIMDLMMAGLHKEPGEPWTEADIAAASGRVIRVPRDDGGEPPKGGGGAPPKKGGDGGGAKQIPDHKDLLLVADPDGRRLHAVDVTDLTTPDAIDAQILPKSKAPVTAEAFTARVPGTETEPSAVPTTEPEPEKTAYTSQLDEIRQRGLDTKKKIQEAFPHLTRAEAGELRRQAYGTVQHPNPAINGQPIISTTADGKVVVANPENKGGISVVTDHTPEATAIAEEPPTETATTAQEAVSAPGSFLVDVPRAADLAPKDDFQKSIIGEKGAVNLEDADRRIGSLLDAKNLEKEGHPPNSIWTTTGWMKGKDGEWRSEIPDVKVKSNLVDELSNENAMKDGEFKLSDVVEGPTAKSLFEAYPDLKDLRVVVDHGGDYVAYHHASKNTIFLGGDALWTGHSIDQIIGHEVQHAIQHREGFAEGASTEFYRSKAQQTALAEFNKIRAKYPEFTGNQYAFDAHDPRQVKDAKRLQKLLKIIQNPGAAQIAKEQEQYYRTAGEVEARNVENRMHMGEAQRKATPLTNTEDRSRKSQIVLKGNDVVARSEKRDIALPSRNQMEDILRTHPLIGLRERVKNIYVVGSYAKGATHPTSDLDVLLEVTPKKGYTASELEEKYRRKLQQYFVTHDIRGQDDSVHPQWNGHRVDVYFTYDASTEKRPKILLSASATTPTQVDHYENEGDRPLDTQRHADDIQKSVSEIVHHGTPHIGLTEIKPSSQGFWGAGTYAAKSKSGIVAKLGSRGEIIPLRMNLEKPFDVRGTATMPAEEANGIASNIFASLKKSALMYGDRLTEPPQWTEPVTHQDLYEAVYKMVKRVHTDPYSQAVEQAAGSSLKSELEPLGYDGAIYHTQHGDRHDYPVHKGDDRGRTDTTYVAWKDGATTIADDQSRIPGKERKNPWVLNQRAPFSPYWDLYNKITHEHREGGFVEKAKRMRDELNAGSQDDIQKSVSEPVQTDTPAFQKWFGDSKVVDERGQPLLVHHATEDEFDTFRTPAFFSSDRESLDFYGDKIHDVYLSIQNPLRVKNKAEAQQFLQYVRDAGINVQITEHADGSWEFEDVDGVIGQHSPYDGTNDLDFVYVPEVRAELKKRGYDGIEAWDTLTNFSIPVWIAFEPTQIKSAIGNNGNFDPNEPDITKSVNEPEGGIFEHPVIPESDFQKMSRAEKEEVIKDAARGLSVVDVGQFDAKQMQTHLAALAPSIASAAQEEYDAWNQDEDGLDDWRGTGGICDDIAGRIGLILSAQGYDIVDGGQDGDDHAFVIADNGKHAFAVDIPPYVYESGGGYSWTKKPDVKLSHRDVAIEPMSREDLGLDDIQKSVAEAPEKGVKSKRQPGPEARSLMDSSPRSVAEVPGLPLRGKTARIGFTVTDQAATGAVTLPSGAPLQMHGGPMFRRPGSDPLAGDDNAWASSGRAISDAHHKRAEQGANLQFSINNSPENVFGSHGALAIRAEVEHAAATNTLKPNQILKHAKSVVDRYNATIDGQRKPVPRPKTIEEFLGNLDLADTFKARMNLAKIFWSAPRGRVTTNPYGSDWRTVAQAMSEPRAAGRGSRSVLNALSVDPEGRSAPDTGHPIYPWSIKGRNLGITRHGDLTRLAPRQLLAAAETSFRDQGVPSPSIPQIINRAAGWLLTGDGGRGIVRGGIVEVPTSQIRAFLPDDFSKSVDEPAQDQDELGFYSQAARTIEAKMPARASADQVRGILSPANGVKADELKWLDIDSFLKDNPKPTKQEVLDYIRANNAKVQEVVKGDAALVDSGEVESWWNDEGGANKGINEDPFPSPGQKKDEGTAWSELTNEERVQAIARYHSEVEPGNSDYPSATTKYDSYVIPGGTNYQEVLLTLPQQQTVSGWEETNPGKAWAPIIKAGDSGVWQKDGGRVYVVKTDNDSGYIVDDHSQILGNQVVGEVGSFSTLEEAKGFVEKHIAANDLGTTVGQYVSSHWNERNVFAHFRTTDREIPGVGKTLLSEEDQGDWSHDGRKKGYDQPVKTLAQVEAEHPGLTDFFNKFDIFIDVDPSDEKRLGFMTEGDIVTTPDEVAGEVEYQGGTPAEVKQAREYAESVLTQYDREGGIPVPQHPFPNTWHEVGFRRQLRLAVEQGYDAMAWAGGDVHVDRWGSERVDWKEHPSSRKDTFAARIKEGHPGVTGGRYTDLRDLGSITQEGLDRVGGEDAYRQQLADKWNIPADQIEVVPNGRRFTVSATEQYQGNAGGMNIEEVARSRGELLEKADHDISSPEELQNILDIILEREHSKAQIKGIADKIWNRMLNEREGTHMPRAEGLRGFYDDIKPRYAKKYLKRWGATVEPMEMPYQDGGYAMTRVHPIRSATGTVYRIEGRNTPAEDWQQITNITSLEDAREYRRRYDRERHKTAPIHLVRITPEMKQSILSEGQMLFSRAAGLKGAHTEDVLGQMSGGTLHDTGELEGNDHDMEALRRLIEAFKGLSRGRELAFNGVTIGNPTIQSVVDFYHDTLRPTMVANGWTEEHLQNFDALVKNMAGLVALHPTHGIVWSDAIGRAEEVIHRKENELGGVTGSVQRQLENHPLFTDPGSTFRAHYGTEASRKQVSEIAAKLETGQASKYGWDKRPNFEQEKESFLSTWANGVIDNAKDLIDEMGYDEFVQRYEEIAKHADTNASSDSGRGLEGKGSESSGQADQANSESPGVLGEGQGEEPPASDASTPDGPTTPDKGVSRAGKRLEDEAVAEGIATALGDTATYDKITVAEQAERANDLVENDLDTALAIMRGTEAPPTGLNPMSVFVALKQHAKDTRDADLVAELARSPLTSESSYHAQSMRMLREAYPWDPDTLVRDLQREIDRNKAGKPSSDPEELRRLESEHQRVLAELEASVEKRAAEVATRLADEQLNRILGEPRPSPYVLNLARNAVGKLDREAQAARDRLKASGFMKSVSEPLANEPLDDAALQKWLGKSVVRDEVYHGTFSDVPEFDVRAQNEGAFFFSADPVVASTFADADEYGHDVDDVQANVMPVHISLQNPQTVPASAVLDEYGTHSFDLMRKAVSAARVAGHDGLIIKDVPDGGRVADQYAVFSPNQIKSRFNRGTYDESGDILKSVDEPLDPTVLKDLAAVGASHIARLGTDPGEFRDAMIREFGDAIEPHVDDIYKASVAAVDNAVGPKLTRKLADAAPKKTVQERIARAVKKKADADISGLVQQLARTYVEKGITDRNDLLDAVHNDLKTIDPNISRRDVVDMISGYGKYRQLSQEQAAITLRDLKGQLQQIAKLDDMAHGQAPKKTGAERRTPSDEERRLIQQVEENKKRGGYNVTDPATQLKTALGAAKTRLRNQIKDLEAQIQTRQKIVKTRTALQYDGEAQELKQRRDDLKRQFAEVFGKPELTDAERLERWKKFAERRTAELQEKLKNGDYAPTPKKPRPELDERGKELMARLEAQKERINALRKINGELSPEDIEEITRLAGIVDAAHKDLVEDPAFGATDLYGDTATPELTAKRAALGMAQLNLSLHIGKLREDARTELRSTRQITVDVLRQIWNTPMSILTFGHGGVIPFTHGRSSLTVPGEAMIFARAAGRSYSYTPYFRRETATEKWKADMAAMVGHPMYKFWVKHGLDVTVGEKPLAMGSAQWTGMAFDALKMMRFELANKYSKQLGDLTPEEAKDLAARINHATGDVNTPPHINKVAGWVMFAPKLRFAKYLSALVDPARSKWAAKRLAKMIAVNLGLLLANYLVNKYIFGVDDEDNVNFTDLSGADWLRGKVAGMTVPMAPTFETARLPFRIGHAMLSPNTYDRWRVAKNEVVYALNPAIGLIYGGLTGQDLATGKDLPFKGLGEYIYGDRKPSKMGKIGGWQYAGAHISPMALEPIVEELAVDGINPEMGGPIVEAFISGTMGEHLYEQKPRKQKR